MTDDNKKASPDRLPEDVDAAGLQRRDFLKVAGAGAGALIVGGSALSERKGAPGLVPMSAPAVHTAMASEMVVVGASGWGNFIALNLRKQRLNVTLVDAY